MLPIAAGLIVGGPMSAKLAGRFGTRTVVAAGLTLVAGALFLLSGAETGQRLLARRRRRSCCWASAWARRWRRPPSRS